MSLINNNKTKTKRHSCVNIIKYLQNKIFENKNIYRSLRKMQNIYSITAFDQISSVTSCHIKTIIT